MNANQKKEIINLLYSAIACLESNDPHFNSAAAWRLADASGLLREALPVGVGSLIGRDEPSGRGFSLPFRVAFEIGDTDLVGMWNAIPEAERKELTKAFAQGFNEQVRGQS